MNRRTLTAACAAVLVAGAALPGAAQKNPWKDASVSLGDIKMHYLEAGTGDRCIVFVPDSAMIAEVWREQIPYFAARGFRVLAIDPRSQGQTTKTDGGNTTAQQAADLYAFLKALKVSREVLVGWGAGASVLLDYLSSPESLKPDRVVLVDGLPVGHQTEDYPSGMTMQRARTALAALQADRGKWTEQWVRGMFRGRPAELTVKEMSQGSLKTPIGALLSQLFDLYTGDWRLDLSRVSVPTLILVPDTNRITGEYLQSKVTGSKLEVVAEAGHALFLEKPQTFNQLLEDFVGGGPGGGP